jgi:hypothetical protein
MKSAHCNKKNNVVSFFYLFTFKHDFMKRKMFLVVAALLAFGMTFFSGKRVKAQAPPPDGSCSPAPNWVCGLNGQNYVNHKLY